MSADAELEEQIDQEFWLMVLETVAKRLEFEALCNEDDQKALTLIRDLGVLLGGFASAVRDQNGEARDASSHPHAATRLQDDAARGTG